MTTKQRQRQRKAALPAQQMAAAANQAERYGVRLAPATAGAGETYWQAASVRHLLPEENRGRHNVYVDVLDGAGQRLRNPALRIGWTWEGRQPHEPADPKPLDKPENEPAGNVDIFRGQHTEVWIQGDGLPSDHVLNLHSDHPDEPGPGGELWNSIGHHSFHVVFQRTRKETGENGGAPPPPPSTFRFEAWPTEFRTITQWFGVDPQYYAQFNLPGHEGIDLMASAGSRIFCVAPGRVKMVHLKPDKEDHNYGIHVRVAHAAGYETIYAHLQSLAVQEGQEVQAGQLLGLADSTGNSFGDHLHLTLKHHGETFDGYPGSIIDPTPFLVPLLAGTPPANDARFAGEFDAVPDGAILAPGHTFTKTWRLVNTGSATWGDGYKLAWLEGQSLEAPPAVAVPFCPPGASADLSVQFTAPLAPGGYASFWRLVDPQGVPFGEKVWTVIQVAALPAGAPELTAAPSPLPAPHLPGQSPAQQLALTAALGMIYNTYWLRMLAASSASDPQQAMKAATDDALTQIQALKV